MTPSFAYLAGPILALSLAASSSLAQTPTPAATSPAEATNFLARQPSGQWLGSMFRGQDVTNAAGESVGNINDVLFDRTGRITTVVIGVGGFLGIGEKNVAIPFDALSITADPSGERTVRVALSKVALEQAPAFEPTEKTTFMKAKEKANEIKEQVSKKIEELKKDETKK